MKSMFLRLLCCLVASPAFAGSIVINEIMFHASPAVPEDDTLEWIELYNRGTNSVNLNGWQFDKGINFAFTNVSIPAGGYLVVAANTNAFKSRNPGINNVVGNWLGVLGNNGEQIRLVNPNGDEEDEVAY